MTPNRPYPIHALQGGQKAKDKADYRQENKGEKAADD